MDWLEFKPVKGYEVINENLGAGSFGVTKLIRDPSLDELFVCKKYEPQDSSNKIVFFDNFKKEIKMMYKINHPNVVRVFTYYLYESHYTGYIIMEYINGMPIDKWFENENFEIDPNDIFRQLIEGFCCIEESGIIHRDIRESNILVTNEGKVKIIDFGLGKDVNDCLLSIDSFNSVINRTNMIKTPEEFEQRKYTSRTDMFCVAELFDRVIKKNNIIDFEYTYILEKMLRYKPEQRYESFRNILADLDKKEFNELEISNEDKMIYNKFIDSLVSIVVSYYETQKFETNTSYFIQGIKKVLDDNCLNYNVGNIKELVDVFIKCGYNYYTNKPISVDSLKDFYDWLNVKDEKFQEVVLKNIISRLSSINVNIESDLPF